MHIVQKEKNKEVTKWKQFSADLNTAWNIRTAFPLPVYQDSIYADMQESIGPRKSLLWHILCSEKVNCV